MLTRTLSIFYFEVSIKKGEAIAPPFALALTNARRTVGFVCAYSAQTGL
jgi:hypothetical protein